MTNNEIATGGGNIMGMQRIEISEDVLTAIKELVEHWHSTDPDDEDIVVNHLPVVEAWLVELGLLSPSAPAIED
jgi:hypothetical protein